MNQEKPQAPDRLSFLNSARGIAILSVFAFHCISAGQQIPWGPWVRDFSVSIFDLALLPLNFGWLGVPVFFVISGFCIHFSFITQGRDWKAFFIRRWFRIYPPYLGAVVLFALVIPESSLHFDLDGARAWRELVYHLLLIHNYNAYTYFGINSSFWSIAIEVQLYLIYPLLIWLTARFGWGRTLLLTALIEGGIAVLSGLQAAAHGLESSFGFKYPAGLLNLMAQLNWLTISPFAYWFSWSLGAKLADDYLNKKSMLLAKTPVIIWIGCILTCYLFRPLCGFIFMSTCLLTATIIGKRLMSSSGNESRPGFAGSALQKIGIWSYSLYLLHQPLIGIAELNLVTLLPVVPPPLRLGVAFASLMFILPLCFLSHRYIELPCVRLGKSFLKPAGSGQPR
jgi:peptidoglycan/LPS O-acetylase OafA/YrhL